jgi:uncharacterized damage-inducible protein DinB
MNPPDDQHGVLDLYKQGPILLEQALHGLSDSELDHAPAQGVWTIREIVHHIVDGDDIWNIFIKMALGNQEGEFNLAWYWIKPQVEWSRDWRYADRAIDVSLALFKANRAHILQILGKIPAAWSMHAQFRKSDGSMEQVPVGMAVQIQANHVVHHIKRIQEIRTNLNEQTR